MNKTENLSRALTIRVTPGEAEMLRAEAKHRNCKSVGAYIRELAVGGIQGQVTPSMLLEVMLRFEHATLETFKEAAAQTNFTPKRIEEIVSQSKANSGTYLSTFQYQESLKIRPEVKTQAAGR